MGKFKDFTDRVTGAKARQTRKQMDAVSKNLAASMEKEMPAQIQRGAKPADKNQAVAM